MPSKLTNRTPSGRMVVELRASCLTWHGIAAKLGISEAQARQLHEDFMNKYGGL